MALNWTLKRELVLSPALSIQEAVTHCAIFSARYSTASRCHFPTLRGKTGGGAEAKLSGRRVEEEAETLERGGVRRQLCVGWCAPLAPVPRATVS